MGEADEYAAYLNQAEKLVLVTRKSDAIKITIQPSSFEIFSFVPIRVITGCNVKFAPVGLVNMFNSGGAIAYVDYNDNEARVHVKGKGTFLAYSNEKPKMVYLNGIGVQFEWFEDGKLTMNVSWQKQREGISEIVFEYCV